jgi:phosphoribosyl 1,2-cyclic phosphate phosphodiesterase
VKITILGSGTSHGVPMIGCHCPVCTSDNPRNRRHRTAALLSFAGRNVLIDTTFELRLQALRAGLDRVDAVLYTHQHADHVCGFDDLRRFCNLQKGLIPCYGNAETMARLRQMFDYASNDPQATFFEIPVVSFNPVSGPFELFGQMVTPVPMLHGRWGCLGYRVGDFAYCTDVREIPAASMELLRGLDTLVLGALRHRPHPTHMTVDQALGVVAALGPRQTYLTHIAHDLDHDATNAALPPNVQLAYDGLILDLSDPAG